MYSEEVLTAIRCEPFEMLIEVGKIREFARAVKSSDPAYLSGWNPVITPTFLVSASFWLEERNSPTLQAGLSMERVLNGAQEFIFHGPPPRAGTRLLVQGRVDKVYEKQGRRGGAMSFMEVVYEFRNEEDVLVAEQRSTVIETSKAIGE